MDEVTAKNIVVSCYYGILGRESDSEGLANYVSFLLRGGSVVDLLNGFIASKEFKNKYFSAISAESSDEKDSVFYFFHIPKTAGMSVKRYLQESSKGLVFPGFFIKDLLESVTCLSNYRYFSGHFLGFLDCLLRKQTRKATLLRDPLEQTISHYLHYIRDPSLPFHEKIKNKTLKEVCKDKRLSGFIRNYQSRYLSTLITDSVLINHTIEERDDLSENDIFQFALLAIEKFEILGVQDEFDPFIHALANSWDLIHLPTIYQENMATNKAGFNIDLDTKKLVFNLTEIDYEIYKIVKQNIANNSLNTTRNESRVG